MNNGSSHAEAKLRKTGLRKTPVRISVLELLERSGRPMSVPQILARLKGVDTVTVYRTLGTFVGKRLVHRVRGDDRRRSRFRPTQVAPSVFTLPAFVADEIVVRGASSAEIDAILAAGFTARDRAALAATGGEIARLAIPPGTTYDAAVERIRAVAPAALVERNHLYRPSEFGCFGAGCAAEARRAR